MTYPDPNPNPNSNPKRFPTNPRFTGISQSNFIHPNVCLHLELITLSTCDPSTVPACLLSIVQVAVTLNMVCLIRRLLLIAGVS